MSMVSTRRAPIYKVWATRFPFFLLFSSFLPFLGLEEAEPKLQLVRRLGVFIFFLVWCPELRISLLAEVNAVINVPFTRSSTHSVWRVNSFQEYRKYLSQWNVCSAMYMVQKLERLNNEKK